MFEKTKINEKEARVGPIKKIRALLLLMQKSKQYFKVLTLFFSSSCLNAWFTTSICISFYALACVPFVPTKYFPHFLNQNM